MIRKKSNNELKDNVFFIEMGVKALLKLFINQKTVNLVFL